MVKVTGKLFMHVLASERTGTVSKDDVVKSNMSAATFDKMRDTLEMYLTFQLVTDTKEFAR